MFEPPRKLARAAVCIAFALAVSAPALARESGDEDAAAVLGIDVPAIVAQAKEAARHAMDQIALDDDAMEAVMPSAAFMSREFGNPREIVKNAPYTADAVTEFVQTLADGNRIVKKSTTLLARDTMGRTRQEKKDGRVVYLYDPLENGSVVIDTESKTVARIPRVPTPPVPPTPPTPPVPPTPPAPPSVTDGSGQVDASPGRVRVRRESSDGGSEDVKVEVVRVGRGEHTHSIPSMSPMPPITLPLVPRGKGETKSLGTRDFDGLKAEGTLTTHTIPAGAIGNERPIVVSTERWFSPDLFVVVYAKTTDPRAGETTYRLTNIKRGEPPADLFKVPADAKGRGEKRKS